MNHRLKPERGFPMVVEKIMGKEGKSCAVLIG